MQTITRIGFCPLCEKEHRPVTGNFFLVFGSTHNCYKVLEAEVSWKHHYGYVPHIYHLVSINHTNGMATIRKSCAMHECGVELRYRNGTNYYEVKKWKTELWKLECWNALIGLKHNFFTKDYQI